MIQVFRFIKILYKLFYDSLFEYFLKKVFFENSAETDKDHNVLPKTKETNGHKTNSDDDYDPHLHRNVQNPTT